MVRRISRKSYSHALIPFSIMRNNLATPTLRFIIPPGSAISRLSDKSWETKEWSLITRERERMHDPPVFWGGKRRRHWWIGATIQQTKLNRASFVSRTGCNFSRSCELGNAGIFSRINDRGRDLTSRYLLLRSFLLQFIRRSPFFLNNWMETD